MHCTASISREAASTYFIARSLPHCLARCPAWICRCVYVVFDCTYLSRHFGVWLRHCYPLLMTSQLPFTRWARVSERMYSHRSFLERANEVSIKVKSAKSSQSGVATVLCTFPKELNGQQIYFFIEFCGMQQMAVPALLLPFPASCSFFFSSPCSCVFLLWASGLLRFLPCAHVFLPLVYSDNDYDDGAVYHPLLPHPHPPRLCCLSPPCVCMCALNFWPARWGASISLLTLKEIMLYYTCLYCWRGKKKVKHCVVYGKKKKR